MSDDVKDQDRDEFRGHELTPVEGAYVKWRCDRCKATSRDKAYFMTYQCPGAPDFV